MRRFLLTLVLLYAQSALAAEAALPALRADLLRWQQVDQAVLHADVPERFAAVVLRRHTEALKSVVARHGWPTITMVGRDGSQAAWLLVQHADDDPAWQRNALRQIEALVDSNEVARQSYAYLADRVAVNSGELQLFGTQGKCVGHLRWEPHPLREPAGVEQRRRDMDLPPLEQYRAKASQLLCGQIAAAGEQP